MLTNCIWLIVVHLSTIKLCKSAHATTRTYFERRFMTHGHFYMGYSESTFSKYAFGRGEGVTKKSTLVKMMTIMDDPLSNTLHRQLRVRRLAGRANIFLTGVASVPSFCFGKEVWAACERLGNVRTPFRRTGFVVQSKIRYSETNITHTKTIKLCKIFFSLKLKPKMRDVLEKMREIRQNAGFPARLRDGWHLCIGFIYLC